MFLEGMGELLKIKDHVSFALQALSKDNGNDKTLEKSKHETFTCKEVPVAWHHRKSPRSLKDRQTNK